MDNLEGLHGAAERISDKIIAATADEDGEMVFASLMVCMVARITKSATTDDEVTELVEKISATVECLAKKRLREKRSGG